VKGYLRALAELGAYVDLHLYRLWDPELYGPEPSRFFRLMFKASLSLAIVLTILAPLLLLKGLEGPIVLALTLAPLLLSYTMPTVWRVILGSGVDKELPAVLAYLIPYTRTPINIADLIAMLKGEGYFWTKFEASRLRFLLNLGYDPLTALKKLAETTPSRGLSEVLRDYINAQTLGVSRGQLTLILFKHAMDSIRDQWRSHIEFGRVVAEGVVAAVVSMAALAPLVLLGGGYPVLLVTIPAVVAPAGALAMLATRPTIGEYRLSYFELLLTITVPFIAIIINFKVSLEAGLAYLLGMTIVVEAIAVGFRRLSSTAMKELRLAVEEARLGLIPEERLAKAERVASGIVKTIISASKIAGTMGIGEALNQILSLVEEAQRHAKSASLQATILAVLSAISIPIAIYGLDLLKNAVETSNLSIVDPTSITYIIWLIAITSPLVALPASILQRGWLISPLYPLLTQALVMTTLKILHLH
jgi:hypothetical protein